jgi:hypothetical protein
MIKNILFFFLLLFVSSTQTFSQDALAMSDPVEANGNGSSKTSLPVFEFKVYANNNDLDAITKEIAGEHFFGDIVSRKLYLFGSKYTFEVQVVPGNPQTKTVVRKPVIYDAVIKIERFLKRSAKKGEITVETATEEFNKVLDVAINVLTSDTGSLEKAISNTNDAASLINLLTKRVNLVF